MIPALDSDTPIYASSFTMEVHVMFITFMHSYSCVHRWLHHKHICSLLHKFAMSQPIMFFPIGNKKLLYKFIWTLMCWIKVSYKYLETLSFFTFIYLIFVYLCQNLCISICWIMMPFCFILYFYILLVYRDLD